MTRFFAAWLTHYVRFRVYTPTAARGYRWPRYQARRYAAPFIFLLWLLRGLRWRAGWAARGRLVTVGDMMPFHPGKAAKCLCRGHGLIFSYRKSERGAQFCAAMLGAFRRQAGFRVLQTKRGPRWLAGFEPEKLVTEKREAKRG